MGVVSDTAATLQFVAWIADRYQERTSRSLFGIRWGGILRCTAIDMAFATYGAALVDGHLKGAPVTWTQDDATALADEDMHYWEAAA